MTFTMFFIVLLFACGAFALPFENNPMHHPDTEEYSSHYCTGIDERELWLTLNHVYTTDWSRHSCTFRNVVWDGTTFIYYMHRDHLVHWDFSNGRGNPIAGDMTENMSKLFGNKVEFKYATVPKDIIVNEHAVVWVSQHEGCTPNNINYGHVLGDCILQIFNSMMTMRMLSIHNQIMLSPDFGDITFPSLWKGLSVHDVKHAPATRLLIPLLMVGERFKSDAMYRDNGAFNNRQIAQTFRDRVISVHAATTLVPTPVYTKPRIGVRYKKSRHRFINHDQLVQHLQDKYADCDIISFSELTFADNFLEEVIFANSLDVYISPSSGGGFSALFAHDGAAVIFGNVCWPGTFAHSKYSNGVSELSRTGTTVYCARQDHWLWGSLPYIHPLYYSPINQTVSEAGLVLDTSQVTKKAEWLDYSYNVDFNSMDHLVDTALILARKAAFAQGRGFFRASVPIITHTTTTFDLFIIIFLVCLIYLCILQ
jgi:hypothetical protein